MKNNFLILIMQQKVRPSTVILSSLPIFSRCKDDNKQENKK